jgi:transposase-like protein
MTWLTITPTDERVRFIAAYLRGELSVSRLCETFGVSRTTAQVAATLTEQMGVAATARVEVRLRFATWKLASAWRPGSVPLLLPW